MKSHNAKGLVGVLVNNIICSRHNIAETLLKLALNTNQSITKNVVNVSEVSINCHASTGKKLVA
jgi:hypothetical protein